MPTEKGGWTTHNEIDYIGKLMSGKAAPNMFTEPQVLLKNYIASAKKRRKRDTFGDVDADQVIGHAQNLRQKLFRDARGV